MSNKMIETISKYGIDYTSEMLAEYVNKKISSENVAIQFILEELEAASQGNHHAREFALSSGFDEDDYKGAMYNSFEEVDGPDGPQQEILNLCMMLYPNQELMAELRIKTVDQIMKMWEIGKYAAINKELRLIDIVKKVNDLEEGVFANINNDLNESIAENHDIMILMAYGYARRVVAAALYLQGVFNRENYMQASNIFRSLQVKTGQSVEFQEYAAEQATEFLKSYDYRIDKNFIVQVSTVVELNQVESAYDNNKYFTDEQIFHLFGQETLWKKTLIKDLTFLTAVDGDMDESEVNLILNIAINDLGFTENEFAEIMENLVDIQDIYPTSEENKYEYLLSLVRMTYADGYIDDNEIEYMKIIAKRMHFSQNIIDDIIDSIENS